MQEHLFRMSFVPYVLNQSLTSRQRLRQVQQQEAPRQRACGQRRRERERGGARRGEAAKLVLFQERRAVEAVQVHSGGGLGQEQRGSSRGVLLACGQAVGGSAGVASRPCLLYIVCCIASCRLYFILYTCGHAAEGCVGVADLPGWPSTDYVFFVC